MGWDEIDFDVIKTGMQTRNGTSVSLADYLNVFSRALDEKYNMIAQHTGSITLPEITFTSGEIRTQSTVFDSFYYRFRQLISWYNSIWFNSDWYTEDVMTDPDNAVDHLITDADLEAAIGAEAYDILVNYATMSNTEIFKASILNGFYIIYQMTLYKGDVCTYTIGSTPQINVATSYRSGSVSPATRVRGFQSGSGFSSYSSAKSDYLANYNPVSTIPTNSSLGTIVTASVTEIGSSAPFTYNYSVNATDGSDIFLKSLDLDSNILTMDFVVESQYLMSNIIINADTAYYPEFPKIGAGDPQVQINMPFESYNTEASYGTRFSRYFFNSDGTAPPEFGEIDDTSRLLTGHAPDFRFYADINNSALEFYIAP